MGCKMINLFTCINLSKEYLLSSRIINVWSVSDQRCVEF